MKRVERGEPSGVKGINVLNVREGFVCEDVCLGMVNKGISVMVECGDVMLKALVDTGCGPNVIFKNAYEKMRGMNVGEKQNKCKGKLKGIGELEMPIIAKVEEELVIGGIRMEEDEFYVIEGVNKKYDVLLGYKFLKKNRMVIHPEKDMLEVRMGKETSVKLYVEENGKVDVKMVSGVDVFAVENVRLP